MADGQVSSGRLDVAKELLTKILNHNQSCAAAYQYLGNFQKLRKLFSKENVIGNMSAIIFLCSDIYLFLDNQRIED